MLKAIKYRMAFPFHLSFTYSNRQYTLVLFGEAEALLLWLGIISHDRPDLEQPPSTDLNHPGSLTRPLSPLWQQVSSGHHGTSKPPRSLC